MRVFNAVTRYAVLHLKIVRKVLSERKILLRIKRYSGKELVSRFSNPAVSKEKICQTYFKIGLTYFEISQTYFRPCETPRFIMQTKKAESYTCFPLCVDLFKLCCTYGGCSAFIFCAAFLLSFC